MAVIRVRRKKLPMTNRVRRVGCKRSVPNRKNAPPLKKKLLAERSQDELQESSTSYVIGLPTSHQKIRDERISDLEKEQEEVTAEIDCSAESYSDLQDISLKQDSADTQFSAEGSDSDVQDMPIQHDTAETQFSAQGSELYVPDTYIEYGAAEGSKDIEGTSEDLSPVNKWACRVCMGAEISIAICFNFQDMPLQHDTAETYFSAEEGISDLQDLPLQHNSADTRLSVEGADSDLQDMPPQNGTAEINFSVEGGTSDLQDMPLQQDITETQFLAEGGNSDLLDMPLQHKTAETHFSDKRDNPELRDMPLQHGTAGC